MKTIFIHGKTKSGRRFTIAGVPDKDKLKIGLAICNPKDQFCKKIGRSISEGRAKNKTYYFELSNDFKENIQIVRYFSEVIIREWNYPYKKR
jgi:hypothetical protein